jgi:hypothetical protein
MLYLVSATPTSPVSPLEISIRDILAGNLSSYSSNPLFGKFESWAARNPDLDFLHGQSKGNVTEDHPTLDGIICDNTHDGCLLASSLAISEGSAHALGLSQYQSGLKLRKRAINAYVVGTHWKTYFEGDHGGHEHYTTWDLHCARLKYVSTGFLVSNNGKGKEMDVFGPNDISTKIFVYNYLHTNQKVMLQQNYACGFFPTKCCVSYYIAKNIGALKMKRFSFDCQSSTKASACQG